MEIFFATDYRKRFSLKLAVFFFQCSVFNRAMRMHRARTMLWQDVRPSLCLSSVCNTPVCCRNGYTVVDILKVFSPSGSPTNLFFRAKRDGNIPTGTPVTGASNARGMKNHDLQLISRFISEMMQDRAIITMEGE